MRDRWHRRAIGTTTRRHTLTRRRPVSSHGARRPRSSREDGARGAAIGARERGEEEEPRGELHRRRERWFSVQRAVAAVRGGEDEDASRKAARRARDGERRRGRGQNERDERALERRQRVVRANHRGGWVVLFLARARDEGARGEF